jgi:hypothetical protein
MPVTDEEKKEYGEFLTKEIVDPLGCLKVAGQEVIWHYTTGAALICIIETGVLHATQVSCLNDSTEVRYASNVFKSALLDLKTDKSIHDEEELFLAEIVRFTSSEPALPVHIPSAWL